MQSGISASSELQSALKSLLSTPSQRALLATISKETIIPLDIVSSSSSDFVTDLEALNPHLKPNEAFYIFLRNDTSPNSGSGPGSLTAVTYVPNAAPVRQKMLFASSRLQLLRDLGSEHFSESVFCTEPSDLTPAGWAKHLAHGEAKNPLTEEEKALEGIREAEALESGGTRGRSLAQGGRIATRVGDDVVSALSSLSSDSHNLVVLGIDVPTETVNLISISSTSVDALSSTISSSEPQFSFYKYSDPDQSIIFISSCPSGAKIKARMLYAASRSNVMSLAEQDAGLKVAKKIEVAGPEEITRGAIEEEFGEREVVEKKAFARPKRPGKR
ncbi:actin depolymerizing protein [Delitschia confertaspora ATCC 74209]|uniref:Actin depolymerizing protein n=1 Tax=Delitschia confertaspora ATCC 74209 TaxID=1513339 RepID=A0A9P4JLJ0_9PLEO|nr:actin depolymerizing protein [Delitschia confertaspora ATCC 74209]